MKSFLRLSHINIENANAVTGMTYGFPAITGFLGFTHALSRKLQKQNSQLKLGGCAIVVHEHQIHTFQPNKWKDSVFCLTRNPPTEKGAPSSFNEEGRMHLTISLVIECHFNGGSFNERSQEELEELVKNIVLSQRIVGGIVTKIAQVKFVEPPEGSDKLSAFIRKEKRNLLPGFLLVERSDLLAEHFSRLKEIHPESELMDAWLDFIALKHQAKLKDENVGESPVEWDWISKPATGWLVPINAGYRAISKLYSPGEVRNARDNHTAFRFVESVYTIGQWLSPHRIIDWDHIFWRYRVDPDAGWYLCKNSYLPLEDNSIDETTFEQGE